MTMTEQKFDEIYFQKRGGFELLKQMMTELKTRKFIANHFGVSEERVSQWSKDLFGKRYDPRKSRHEKRLEFMIEMAPLLNHDKWREAFSYDTFQDEALAIISIRGIKFKDE